MKKKVLFGALALFVFFVIVVLINLNDASLDPDILAFNKSISSGLETPGLEMFLGLSSKSENWKEVGAQFKQELELLETNPNQKAYSAFSQKYKNQKAALDPDQGSICKPICSNEELERKRSGNLRYLQEHRDILSRYREYLTVPNVREPAFPHFIISMMRAYDYVALKNIFHLDLQVNPDHLSNAEIVQLLVLEGQYFRRTLNQKKTALGLMVALNDLRDNMRFLSDFISRNPAAKVFVPSEYLAEIRNLDSKLILKNALDGEMVISQELVLLDPGAFSFDGEPRPWMSIFFQRNATVNGMWKAYQDFYNSACVQSDSDESCLQIDKLQPNFPWYSYLINPVGKIIAKIMLPRIGGVYEKIQKLNSEIQNLAQFASEKG